MVAFTQLLLVLTCVALANAIPMSFRKEIPADETPIAMFRDSEDNKDYRLPNNTIPLRYDIWLSTDVDKAGQAEFSGKVQITIQVLEASNQITLHSRQQTIVRIDLLNESRNPIQSDIEFTKNEDVEFLNIPLTSPLDITLTYILDITYTGLLRDDNLGFYRSSYKNASGDTVWIATTQFEETDARHAFPCYDEPHLRAVFSISITHHKSYNAISNWPVISVTPSETASENYVDTKFQDTERVQTYLIAFIVSDFKSIENTAAKKQRVFAKPKSIEDGEAALALDAGQKLLDKFVEHLGVEYSPPKMDQVAVPDFDAGKF